MRRPAGRKPQMMRVVNPAGVAFKKMAQHLVVLAEIITFTSDDEP